MPHEATARQRTLLSVSCVQTVNSIAPVERYLAHAQQDFDVTFAGQDRNLSGRVNGIPRTIREVCASGAAVRAVFKRGRDAGG